MEPIKQATLSGLTVQVEQPKKTVQRHRRYKMPGNQPKAQAQLTSKKTYGQLEDEGAIQGEIEECNSLLEFINETLRLKNEDEPLFLMVMHIERYGGSNLPWFLNIINGEPEIDDQTFPNLENYELGYYSRNHEQQPGTFAFIRARCTWAKQYYEKELSTHQETLKTQKSLW